MTDPASVGIDPRLYENNADEQPREWIAEKLTVIYDFWLAEWLKTPECADAEMRRHGFAKTADRLVELLGERWWERAATRA